MKRFWLLKFVAQCITVFSPAAQAFGFTGDETCRSLAFKSQVEVAGPFTLANLMFENACPQVLKAAQEVHLGRAPLGGSPRVFTDIEVRELFDKVLASQVIPRGIAIPPRITVRRAGSDTCCMPPKTTPGESSPRPRGRTETATAISERSVRAGQRANLLWEQDGIRMVVPVTCLESGTAGARVHVQFLLSKRSMPAIVVDAQTLRSNF